MKVLLCSPISENGITGGIGTWTEGLINYYKLKGDKEIELSLFKLNRSEKVYSKKWTYLNRIIWGTKDYTSHLINFRKRIREGYDIVHISSSAQMGLIKDLLMLSLARANNINTVIHFHFGRIPEVIESNNWEWKLLKRVCKKSTTVIVMDSKSKNALIRFGFSNVVNIPNPLPSSIIDEIDNLKFSITERKSNHLLFVGHVIPTKGCYELFETFKRLPSDYHLDIVGYALPEIKERLVTIAGDVAGRVHFIGEISHSEVLKYFLSSGLFVLPTYTEGFPYVILESMACGCPIVTTDVGAIPDMLKDDDTPKGICVVPRDIDGLEEAVKKMCNDADYANDCVINAHNKVIESYSIERVWQMLCEAWQKTSTCGI